MLGAQTYDSLNIEFSKLVEMMNTGNKAPRVKVLVNTFEEYETHLSSDFDPFFREVLSNSVDTDNLLRNVENIPVLRSFVDGCIRAAFTRLERIQEKTLGIGNIETYAITVTCVGYIRMLIDELGYFFQGNRSYLIDHGYKDRFYAIHARARAIEKGVLEESNLYLRFLIHD